MSVLDSSGGGAVDALAPAGDAMRFSAADANVYGEFVYLSYSVPRRKKMAFSLCFFGLAATFAGYLLVGPATPTVDSLHYGWRAGHISLPYTTAIAAAFLLSVAAFLIALAQALRIGPVAFGNLWPRCFGALIAMLGKDEFTGLTKAAYFTRPFVKTCVDAVVDGESISWSDGSGAAHRRPIGDFDVMRIGDEIAVLERLTERYMTTAAVSGSSPRWLVTETAPTLSVILDISRCSEQDVGALAGAVKGKGVDVDAHRRRRHVRWS